jgi:predicted ArsR family transcriptional regulator
MIVALIVPHRLSYVNHTMNNLGNARQRVLLAIKNAPGASIATVSEELGFTYEAVRQQVNALEREGWIRSEYERPVPRSVGRPLARYRLTTAGEHLFPKQYDLLANTIIATAAKSMGPDVVRSLLATITSEQVGRWRPLLEGLTLDEKLEKLRDLYQKEDPYIAVERTGEEVRLIERNCPFLSTAAEHPELCSISVSTLRSLLGYHVYREERFQSGHGRCVFRIDTSRPIDASERDRFTMESPVEPPPR